MPPAGRCDSQGVPRAPSASSGPRAVPRPAALPGLPHPTTAARPCCAAPPKRSHLRHRPVRLRQPPDRTARHQRGDPAMARARDRFLATGSYAPVRARRWRLAAAALPDRGAVGPVEARGPRPGSPSSAATSPNDPCLSRPEPRHGSRKEAEPEHMTAWSEPVIRCRVTRPTRRDVTRAPARSFRSCPWPR